MRVYLPSTLPALAGLLLAAQIGPAPVRGFAVTLVIGLLSNVFTSIYVSRAIFDWNLSRMGRQSELSI